MSKAMLLFRVKLNDKHGHPRTAESSTSLTVIHIHRYFYQLIMAVTSLLYKISKCVTFLTHRSVFVHTPSVRKVSVLIFLWTNWQRGISLMYIST